MQSLNATSCKSGSAECTGSSTICYEIPTLFARADHGPPMPEDLLLYVYEAASDLASLTIKSPHHTSLRVVGSPRFKDLNLYNHSDPQCRERELWYFDYALRPVSVDSPPHHHHLGASNSSWGREEKHKDFYLQTSSPHARSNSSLQFFFAILHCLRSSSALQVPSKLLSYTPLLQNLQILRFVASQLNEFQLQLQPP